MTEPSKTENVYKSDILTTSDELYEKIMQEYRNNEVEMSEGYFEGIIVNMSKADLLRAYRDIQYAANSDEVVRLDKDLKAYPKTELVPSEWERIYVAGDACAILTGINKDRSEGYSFGRFCEGDRNELLDLLWGRYERRN